MSDVAAASADAVEISGNVSVSLDDPGRAWIVSAGRVLVFASDLPRRPGPQDPAPQHPGADGDGATVPGARQLVLEADEGDLLFGVDARGVGRRWFVLGIAQAEISPVDIAAIVSQARPADSPMRDRLQRWLDRTGVDQASAADLLVSADPAAWLRDHAHRAAVAETEEGGRRRERDAARIVAAEAQVESATRVRRRCLGQRLRLAPVPVLAAGRPAGRPGRRLPHRR